MSRNGSVRGCDSFFGGETVKLHENCLANPISVHDKKNQRSIGGRRKAEGAG